MKIYWRRAMCVIIECMYLYLTWSLIDLQMFTNGLLRKYSEKHVYLLLFSFVQLLLMMLLFFVFYNHCELDVIFDRLLVLL